MMKRRQHRSIPQQHRFCFHILTYVCNQCDAFLQKFTGQCFTDIPVICLEFTHITVHHLVHRFCVVYIRRGHFGRHYSALMIHNQMQLKAIEPPHSAAALQSRQGFMAMNT